MLNERENVNRNKCFCQITIVIYLDCTLVTKFLLSSAYFSDWLVMSVTMQANTHYFDIDSFFSKVTKHRRSNNG